MSRNKRNQAALVRAQQEDKQRQEEEWDRRIGKYEAFEEHHPLLCKPGPKIEIQTVAGFPRIRIPVFGRLGGRGDYRHDAYYGHVWEFLECNQVAEQLDLTERFKQCQRRASQMFFHGGKFVADGERYCPEYNNPLLKHFIHEAYGRVRESFHIPHEQKIAATGLMLAAWTQPI